MKGHSIAALCRRAGMSRQNYYARRRQRQKRSVDADLVLRLVQRERQEQPRLGGRKLLHLVGNELRENKVEIGRDRFFGVLREHGLLLEPKPARPKTTNSRHSLPVFRNLVAEMKLTAPNQAWAADVTYIRTDEGFLYAALLTDMFSRQIVGADIGDSLEADGCLRALNAAVLSLPAGAHPIHHSDRGSQYCCHRYVKRLRAGGLGISMTEEMHCYENALAERVNGILKQEYGLDSTFRAKDQARKAFKQAVWLYNHRRPHVSLNYRIPAEVHRAAA
jgi:transposase InsO family protein